MKGRDFRLKTNFLKIVAFVLKLLKRSDFRFVLCYSRVEIINHFLHKKACYVRLYTPNFLPTNLIVLSTMTILANTKYSLIQCYFNSLQTYLATVFFLIEKERTFKGFGFFTNILSSVYDSPLHYVFYIPIAFSFSVWLFTCSLYEYHVP